VRRAGRYADTHDDDLTPVAMGRFMVQHLGRGGGSLRRASMVGHFLVSAGRCNG
jgi:hypothetical protein